MYDKRLNAIEFYSGRSIFITGGSGFLGKALIEKLLRSCTNLKEIFVLMRPKKGMSVDERLQKMISIPLFDKLRETNPSAFKKLIPVTGDAAKEGLGLDAVERQVLMDRVSIVFHVAASVRFDDSLRDAVFINTRSTRDICILAGGMKNLVVLVHVSSTYAHADMPVVEEIFYPSDVDWKKTIKIAENVDNTLLKTLTAKYLGEVPNTYTFTKKLAECVIHDYSDRLPCVIFRPSIVVSTVSDPMPGWLDNFNGPTGLMIGGGKGILRTVYGSPDVVMDYIPLDVTVKAMILVACKRGRTTISKDPSLHVYNCATNKLQRLSMSQIISISLKNNEEFPLENCMWWPNTKITTCYFYFYINVLLFHLLPALILDELINLAGHQRLLVRLQKRVFVSNVSVGYFMLHQWDFKNNNILNLIDSVTGVDEPFRFTPTDLQISEFLKSCVIGAKLYLLHESLDNLEQSKRHQQRMHWIDRICKALWIALAVWAFFHYGIYAYLCNSIDETLRFIVDDHPIS